ncbi:MAG: hypothetical protein JWO98_5148, partial [Frankiales bacterium]|nr:hypothetical protein [Frankiales bacterium]
MNEVTETPDWRLDYCRGGCHDPLENGRCDACG